MNTQNQESFRERSHLNYIAVLLGHCFLMVTSLTYSSNPKSRKKYFLQTHLMKTFNRWWTFLNADENQR